MAHLKKLALVVVLVLGALADDRMEVYFDPSDAVSVRQTGWLGGLARFREVR